MAAHGQGIFVYDQRTVGGVEGGLGLLPFTEQSFTPTLSSVGFVQLWIYGGLYGPGTLYVNLRSDSISGPILGSTTPVALPSMFGGGVVDFLFAAPVSVTPGVTYYIEPKIQTGGGWGWILMGISYPYPGGMAYHDGVARPNNDFWFAEGIVVVPEPTSAWLLLLGGGVLFYVRRNRPKGSPR